LPTPDEVIRSLGTNESGTRPQGDGGASPAAPERRDSRASMGPVPSSPPRGAPRAMLAPVSDPVAPEAPAAAPPIAIGRFEDLIALATSKRDIGVKLALERDVR